MGSTGTEAVEVVKVTAEFVGHFAEGMAIEPPLLPEELIAVTGLINGTRVDSGDIAQYELRFDIVQASDRKKYGNAYKERDLALNGLYKILRD